MASSLSDAVDRLKGPRAQKSASYEGAALRALAASVRAAPLRPVNADDFHAVKLADWDALSRERSELVEKISASDPVKSIGRAVRVAGIDDLSERRDKIAAHGLVARALTLLHRGST